MRAYEKIQAFRNELNRKFPEREQIVEGCLMMVLAAEHVCLIGPPGTAKSSLARAIAKAFGGSYFERLLTKFSTPEELFGVISLEAMERGSYERSVAGMLPEAEFAFIDEVYKANSAVLNTMLGIMNERLFNNGKGPQLCPLVTLFGASNELPEGKDLEALHDRFLMRFDVQYLERDENFRGILRAPDPIAEQAMSMAELREAQHATLAVEVTPETEDALTAIRTDLKMEGVVASDRRWKRCLKVAQAGAYLLGQSRTSKEDLAPLADSLWREPKERRKVAVVVARHTDPVGHEVREVYESARERQQKLKQMKMGLDKYAFRAPAAGALDEWYAQIERLWALEKRAGRRVRGIIKPMVGEIDDMIDVVDKEMGWARRRARA